MVNDFPSFQWQIYLDAESCAEISNFERHQKFQPGSHLIS